LGCPASRASRRARWSARSGWSSSRRSRTEEAPIERIIRSALFTTDHAFRETVREALRAPDHGVMLALEIAVPFTQCGNEQLQALRQADPQLVILDLTEDPELGLRLAQFLLEQHPGRCFIASGPELSPELLMMAMRAGVTEYLQRPVTIEAVTEAVERAALKLGRAPATDTRPPGQMLAFFSPKGGSGSTTVAANLAVVLHQLTGKRTLLLDLDLELGELALVLGVRPRFNFVDMVQNFHRMDSGLLASFIQRHDSGVELLSAPYHPDRAEVVTGEQLRRILLFLKQHYDYVVVDTSKAFSQATLVTFEQADLVFLVATADLPSLRNIQRTLPMMRRTLVRGEEQLRLILNRYDAGDTITVSDIEKTLGLKVFWKLSNDYEAVIGSLNSGKPIVLNGTSKYSKDLKALSAALVGLKPGSGTRRGGIAAALTGALGLRNHRKKGGNTDG
jgi:pilus assembly protein CpaE